MPRVYTITQYRMRKVRSNITLCQWRDMRAENCILKPYGDAHFISEKPRVAAPDFFSVVEMPLLTEGPQALPDPPPLPPPDVTQVAKMNAHIRRMEFLGCYAYCGDSRPMILQRTCEHICMTREQLETIRAAISYDDEAADLYLQFRRQLAIMECDVANKQYKYMVDDCTTARATIDAIIVKKSTYSPKIRSELHNLVMKFNELGEMMRKMLAEARKAILSRADVPPAPGDGSRLVHGPENSVRAGAVE